MTAQDTKATIIETARRLFHEQGYHGTGISTILREADVNSGSLYHFFPSKEALLLAVLEKYVDLLHPMVMGPAEQAAADPIDRIFALLAFYRQGLEMTGHKMGCPIGNLALELGDDHPDIRKLIHQNFTNWATAIEGWLDSAKDRLPLDFDRRDFSRFVLTVMEGGIMQARAAQSLEPYDASVRQLRAYVNSLLEQRRHAAGNK